MRLCSGDEPWLASESLAFRFDLRAKITVQLSSE